MSMGKALKYAGYVLAGSGKLPSNESHDMIKWYDLALIPKVLMLNIHVRFKYIEQPAGVF